MSKLTFNAENWAIVRRLWEYWYYTLGDDDNDADDRPFSSPFIDRKCRLLVVAALRGHWDEISDPRTRYALELFEQFSDDLDPVKSARAEALARQVDDEVHQPINGWSNPDNRWDYHLASFVRSAVSVNEWCQSESIRYKWVNLLDELCSSVPEGSAVTPQAFRLFHDIFGNPFRPPAFSPEWRTDTAVALARTMYEAREFGAMPILADALQDAGCDNDDVLNHCRGPGPHVRGCWVCDLVLGKA